MMKSCKELLQSSWTNFLQLFYVFFEIMKLHTNTKYWITKNNQTFQQSDFTCSANRKRRRIKTFPASKSD